MTPTNSLVSTDQGKQIEMEVVVPEEYMDIITCEFAYDPVRLPRDQDATQSLYDRKTLETIWETKREARNPFTKQWFNAKSAIPQTELRQQMEYYIKHQKFSARGGGGAKLEVIEEYTKILEEEHMKQYLDILGKCLTKNVATKEQCSTMWKKINLLRMYCQFHSKNIETFRSLHGFIYLNELIIQVTKLVKSNSIEKDTKETAWIVCKEIARAIDVIGLEPLDMHAIKLKSKEVYLIGGYIKMIDYVFLYKEGYMKLESLMLRMFCKIFDEMSAQTEHMLGKELYQTIVGSMGSFIATEILSETNAEDLSSEDLNHGISILRRTWITTSSFDQSVQMLVNAVILCIARETDRLEEMRDLSEGRFLEAEAEGRYNCEALEKGLCLFEDILMTEGPPPAGLLQGGLDIVEEIFRMFNRFTCQGDNEDETSAQNFPVFCAKKGCKIYECIQSRIVQL